MLEKKSQWAVAIQQEYDPYTIHQSNINPYNLNWSSVQWQYGSYMYQTIHIGVQRRVPTNKRTTLRFMHIYVHQFHIHSYISLGKKNHRTAVIWFINTHVYINPLYSKRERRKAKVKKDYTGSSALVFVVDGARSVSARCCSFAIVSRWWCPLLDMALGFFQFLPPLVYQFLLPSFVLFLFLSSV